MFVFLLSSCITDFFQVFVQSGEAVLPQDAVSREPTERRAQRSGVDLASVHAAFGFDLQQARVLEDAQVPRDRRQAHIVGLGEFAHGGVTGRELFEDGPPDRVGQRREDGVQVQGDRRLVNHLVNRYACRIFNDMVKRPFRAIWGRPRSYRENLHQDIASPGREPR